MHQNISSEINTDIHETSPHYTDHDEIIIPGVDPLTFVDVNLEDEQNYDFKPASKISSNQNFSSANFKPRTKISSNQNLSSSTSSLGVPENSAFMDVEKILKIVQP